MTSDYVTILYRIVGFEKPWIGYLALANGVPVGTCGFKSPPRDGRVACTTHAPDAAWITPVVNLLVSVPVLLAGLYLDGLAAVAVVSPQRATLFLSSFASSAFAHFFELSVRLVVGAALVMYAPQMQFAGTFLVFGWAIVVTTLGLFAVPWRWHHRFANWSVPTATRRMALFALGSLAGGAFMLLSVFLGPGFEHWRAAIAS